jgi:UDP-2-acetamido-2-deoxy-ribo-hexuluronate aminotransferase
MEKIKMVDLLTQYLHIKPEIDAAIEKVLMSTAFIQGPEVTDFAHALGAYVSSPFVIPCANGTDALQIAMMALDLKPGDEVILPVHTYVATAEVLALLGLTPVFIDVNADTFNIDVALIEEKISPKTKAIVPVHLYGQCADMEPILEIASRHRLYVIEDAAQALGAIYTFSNGQKHHAGTMGTIGTTSFFPSKNLGCFGDGGAIFTDNKHLSEKIKMIANHGQRIKYHHDVVGINSRLDTMQAAILQVKLKYLQQYTQARNEAASFYNKALQAVDFVETPAVAHYSSHVYHQYTLKIKNRNRDELKEYLEKRGIPSMIYYPVPLHLQKAYRRAEFGEESFPVTEKLSKSVISLPMHTEMKREELAFICESIRNF